MPHFVGNVGESTQLNDAWVMCSYASITVIHYGRVAFNLQFHWSLLVSPRWRLLLGNLTEFGWNQVEFTGNLDGIRWNLQVIWMESGGIYR